MSQVIGNEIGAFGINVNPGREPIPMGLFTDILPEEPVAGIAVIVLPFTILNDAAGVPPKLTPFADKKFVPVIVTRVPSPALVGKNEETVAPPGPKKVNPAKVAVAPDLATDTWPEAPNPSTAVMVVSFTTVKDAAGTLPNETSVTPVNFVPFIVSVVPIEPVVGKNEFMPGADTMATSSK